MSGVAGKVLLAAALSLGVAATGCSDEEEKKEEPIVDAGSDAADTNDMGDADDDAGDATQSQAVRIDGLSAPVKVQFDPSGVLHIDCQTDLDCYAAQGYFHADHRFFEMDLIRRQTRGQLSQVIGQLGLDGDKQFRHLMTTRDGTPLEEAYLAQVSDETRAMLDAYANGVNAWLADMRAGENDATLTREYEFPLVAADNIRDWEPADTIALYLQLAYQLSETATDDLFRGEMATRLDPEVAADLFSVKPGLESNTMQASGVDPSTMIRSNLGGALDPAVMRAAKERLHPAMDAMAAARKRFDDNPSLLFGPRNGEDGSNNWVVAPSRTANGKAILADDPHLSLNNPAIWYFVELDSKTNGEGNLHVVGASVPAVPGIVVGHNNDVAWGVTTARLDLADAYIEELNDDGTAVMFNGQEVPLLQKDFTFETSDGQSITETFEWVPHHGPLISKDVANNRGVSIKWVLNEAGNDIDFLNDLMTATTTAEAMDALGPVRAINQNWIFMDRAGSIGWNPKGAIPNRPFATTELPNWLPLPGDGSAEWDGYLSEADSPKMVDPSAGFIATANNDMDGSYTDGDPTNDGHSPWQSPPAYGHRHKRIVELIEEGGNSHTVDTMHEIQADTYVLHGEVLVPHILQVANDNADQVGDEAQKVVDALADWQYTCPTGLDGTDPNASPKSSDADEARESIGCAAFHVMLPYLTEAVFADEIAEGSSYETLANWYSLQSALIYVFDAPGELNRGEDYFDDVSTDASAETKTDVVLEVLDTTAAKLAEDTVFASSTPDDWRWGRIHWVKFTSLFASAGVSLFDNGPFANDGGFSTVDVANPTGRAGDFDDSWNHPNGPSLRVVFEATDDGIDAWFQLPGGQDHHEDSEFYGSLIDEWLSNTPTELLYDRDEVDAAAVETIEVQPAE
ncbi:penicillin acylase family protein [Persicimonas caeni]|nr:penicillin acylase family protein [Persicimonas caeni]